MARNHKTFYLKRRRTATVFSGPSNHVERAARVVGVRSAPHGSDVQTYLIALWLHRSSARPAMISRTTNVAALLRSQIDRFGLQLKHLEHTRWRLRVARHALEKLRATAGLSLPHVKPSGQFTSAAASTLTRKNGLESGRTSAPRLPQASRTKRCSMSDRRRSSGH